MAAMVLGWGTAQAVPLVSHVAGTIADGASITITGNGFGAVGPNIVLFDDFEKGTVGENISTAIGSAQVGNWGFSEGAGVTTYSNQAAHSGSQSMGVDWTTTESNGPMHAQFSNSSEVFYSFWTIVPIGKMVPGDGHVDGPNWKITWIMGATFPDSDYVVPVVLSSDFSTLGVFGYDGMDMYNGRYRFPDDTSMHENWWWNTSDWVKGQWKRFDVYLKGGQTTGMASFIELTSSGRVVRVEGTNTFTLSSGHFWTQISFPGYGRRPTPNGFTAYDDVYVSTGPGARARVEIGNSPTYAGSGNLTISTVTAWNDGAIEATIRAGSFRSGAAYLYVVDANGEVNANGYPVAFGAPAQSQPSPPKGFRVR